MLVEYCPYCQSVNSFEKRIVHQNGGRNFNYDASRLPQVTSFNISIFVNDGICQFIFCQECGGIMILPGDLKNMGLNMLPHPSMKGEQKKKKKGLPLLRALLLRAKKEAKDLNLLRFERHIDHLYQMIKKGYPMWDGGEKDGRFPGN